MVYNVKTILLCGFLAISHFMFNAFMYIFCNNKTQAAENEQTMKTSQNTYDKDKWLLILNYMRQNKI